MTCPECGRAFSTVQGLGRHRTTAHGAAKTARSAKRTTATDVVLEVREELRDLVTPLREKHRSISARLSVLDMEAAELRAARKDIEAVLAKLDPSTAANRKKVSANVGTKTREEEKRKAVREFIELNHQSLAEGFTAAELNRMMKEDEFGPVMSAEKTRVFMQQLQSEGVVRADRIVKGGGMQYLIVGNSDAQAT